MEDFAMLSFFERVQRAGGLSRRQFLSAGPIGGGLTLARLLEAEQAAGIRSSHKAVINIHLDGGPPQMDMIDLKPQAPAEIRGEFSPIATAIPGVHICELLPKMAAAADKLVFIRSLVGASNLHDAFERPLEDKMVVELADKGAGHTTALALSQELSLNRLQDRTSLRTGLDRLRGQLDRSGSMDALDSFTKQAVGILTSGRFAAAMDL